MVRSCIAARTVNHANPPPAMTKHKVSTASGRPMAPVFPEPVAPRPGSGRP
jgi:hypothetical protein